MKKLILAAVVLTFMIAPSLAWFDTGYPFRVVERINYTGSTTLYNFTYPVNSSRFNVGGIDTGDQTVWVKIPVLNPGINSQFLYYNDNYNYTSVATSDLTQNGMQVDIGNATNVSSAWDSHYVFVYHMTVGWEDPNLPACVISCEVGSCGGFGQGITQPANCQGSNMFITDNSPSGNAGQLMGDGSGNPFLSPDILPFPARAFGLDAPEANFTLETVVAMSFGIPIISYNDPVASDVYVQLTQGGSSYCNVNSNQFGFMLENTTRDKTCLVGDIPSPRTSSDYNYVAITYLNHVISMYVNGQLQNTTVFNGTARFTSNEGQSIAEDNVNFVQAQLSMDELSSSNVARSADWIKARYESMLANKYGNPAFSVLGMQQVQNPSLNLTIQSPSGNYVGSVPMNLSVAFTTEGQLDTSTCSYQLDGNAPQTISQCRNTTLLAGAGSHSLILFASSLDGANVNATSPFNVTRPASLNLTLTSPTGNYNTSSLPLSLNISFTTHGQLNTSSCYYKRDGGIQTTILSCFNLSFSETSAGNHTIFVAASSLDGASANATSSYSVTVNAAPPSPATGKVTGISAIVLLLFPVFMALIGLLSIIKGLTAYGQTKSFMNSVVIGIVVIILSIVIYALAVAAV